MSQHLSTSTRRRFIQAGALAAGGLALGQGPSLAGPKENTSTILEPLRLRTEDLPKGSAPPPVALPHFPDTLHAFVWRNWPLVDIERMARVVGAKPADLLRMGHAMGLAGPPRITPNQRRRSYLTIIRRNWHLLPYEQLLQLLEWTPDQMAFALREDDFLYIKLGSLKPKCEPVRYSPPNQQTQEREREIGHLVRETFPAGVGLTSVTNGVASKLLTYRSVWLACIHGKTDAHLRARRVVSCGQPRSSRSSLFMDETDRNLSADCQMFRCDPLSPCQCIQQFALPSLFYKSTQSPCKTFDEDMRYERFQ
jgi:hypothetical protein